VGVIRALQLARGFNGLGLAVRSGLQDAGMQIELVLRADTIRPFGTQMKFPRRCERVSDSKTASDRSPGTPKTGLPKIDRPAGDIIGYLNQTSKQKPPGTEAPG
jgi:hypothetical protein